MYLYGIGCLLSLNYLQADIFSVLFAYFAMLAIVGVLVLTIIDSISEKLRVGAHIFLYLILAVWYLGIIIDYFRSYSS